jgi:hypothetical protein
VLLTWPSIDATRQCCPQASEGIEADSHLLEPCRRMPHACNSPAACVQQSCRMRATVLPHACNSTAVLSRRLGVRDCVVIPGALGQEKGPGRTYVISVSRSRRSKANRGPDGFNFAVKRTRWPRSISGSISTASSRDRGTLLQTVVPFRRRRTIPYWVPHRSDSRERRSPDPQPSSGRMGFDPAEGMRAEAEAQLEPPPLPGGLGLKERG